MHIQVKTTSNVRWSQNGGTLYAQREGKDQWVEVWQTYRGWNAVVMRDEPLRHGREWKEWDDAPFMYTQDAVYFACCAAERFLGVKKPTIEIKIGVNHAQCA